jgi:hypothetical protein
MEPTLQNALDAVNRGRRWTLFGIGSLFFAVLIILAVLNMMIIPSLQPPAPATQGTTIDAPTGASIAVSRVVPLKVLWVSAAVQLLFVACGTIVIMLHVSRMTRTILRAIEAMRR